MAAGSRDRPPMLAPGRYPQWRLRFLRYVDTRPNGEALRKCILSGPYKLTTVLVQAVKATDNSPAVPEHTTVEMPTNICPENKAHFLTEKEAIHLILTGIRDDIYLTVDACQTAQEMCEAIERLQQENLKTYQQQPPNILKLQEQECGYDFTFKNGNQSGQFGTQRIVNVVVARENVGSKVVQQSGIQCFNCREFGHFAKECRNPKMVKDSAYHKEKMLMCKQAEQGVLLQSKQYDCNTCLVETDDSNVTPESPDMCEDDIQNEQNDEESDDEHVALANLIANIKLDTKQAEFEKYKAFNDHTVDYGKLEHKLNEALGQLAHKDTVIRE
nr:hypothetical protein [Tanacetum cinerariifolium]